MKEIVDRILQEEQLARSRVEQAQAQAHQIITAAKEEAASLIQRSVNDAKDLAESRKEAARKSFLEEKESILKGIKDDVALSRSKKEQDIPAIAAKIFSKIITIKG